MSIRSLVAMCVPLICLVGGDVVAGESPGPAPRPLGRDLSSFHAPDDPAAVSQKLEEPSGPLQLREALALTLMHNPALATFSWEVRAREAATLQAGAWPNLEVGLEYENFAFGGVFEGSDFAEATLALSQLVLLGGKLGKRTEVARLDNALAGWDYETARIEAYARTVGAFVGLLAAQERLSLTEKIVAVAEDIEDAVSTRVRAGGTLALEENRARAALEGSRIEQILAERQVTISRRELAAMWGSSEPRFAGAVGALEKVGSRTPSLDSLLSRVDQNPHVARWANEFQRRRARVNLARADRVPDLNIIAGLRHYNEVDDYGFVAGIAAQLPTWDRKKGAIREAEFQTAQVDPARQQIATEIGRDIAVAYEVLAGAHEEITRLRDRVLPEAEAAANSSGDAYRAGAIRLTDVLDIQRTYFRLRIRYVNALARYHGAVAELEGLTGEPLDEFDGSFGKREDQ